MGDAWIGLIGGLVGVGLGGLLTRWQARAAEKEQRRNAHADRVKAAAVAFLSVITATEHYAWALLRAPDDDSIRGKLAELHEQRGLTQLALALATEREDVRRASREVRRYAYRSAENAKLGKGPKEPWVDKNGDDTLCPHDGLTNNKRALAAALAKELDVEDLFAGLIDD